MDIKQIKNIIKDFEKSSLTSLEIENEGFKIKLKKGFAPETSINEHSTNIKEEQVAKGSCSDYEIKSPLVGTFYHANSFDSAPFVNVGDYIEKGQIIGIIEAMKIMNEITSPTNGVVKTINVKNGSPIGYDQIIMTLSL